jgi:type II secretory pathway pseudopilin PulG
VRARSGRKRKGLRKGITLFEALIGISIVGVAMLGLAQAFLVAVANNTRAGEIGHASFLAQQRIDELRTLTADELILFPSLSEGGRADEVIDNNLDGTPDFRRLTRLRVGDLIYDVTVYVFPAVAETTASSVLIQDPWANRVRAMVHTVISR